MFQFCKRKMAVVAPLIGLTLGVLGSAWLPARAATLATCIHGDMCVEDGVGNTVSVPYGDTGTLGVTAPTEIRVPLNPSAPLVTDPLGNINQVTVPFTNMASGTVSLGSVVGWVCATSNPMMAVAGEQCEVAN